MAMIDDFLARAGEGATVMVAEGDAFEDLRANTPAEEWGRDGHWRTYRGARVEIHDEWAWGWMVRRADGSFVQTELTGPEREKYTKLGAERSWQSL